MSTCFLFLYTCFEFVGGKESSTRFPEVHKLFTEQTSCTCIKNISIRCHLCMLSGIQYHFKIVLSVTIHVHVDDFHAGTLSLLVTIKDWTCASFLGSFQNWRRRGEH